MVRLGKLETKGDAKIELAVITSELMPKGIPMLAETRKYPTIESLVPKYTKKVIVSILLLMVRDFCGSVNVVRNMNDDQMIEAASMLLDECGNFRLEDYQIMFTMAKRGQLGKIYDRIDIETISLIMNDYWQVRNAAGKEAEAKETWKPPENPVSSEKVGELFKKFNQQVYDSMVEENKDRQRERVAFSKSLDQVLEDLSDISNFRILPPFKEPEL